MTKHRTNSIISAAEISSLRIRQMTQDEQLFYAAMHDVTPLKSRTRYPIAPRHRCATTAPIHPKTAHTNIDTPFHSNLSDNIGQSVTLEQPLFFNRGHLSKRQLKDIQRGKVYIDASIDLHGKTINQARSVLHQFIVGATAHHDRLVLVIHGKGCRTQYNRYPILKNKVNAWLPQLPQVRAFCSASPKHGGTGAVYVYLKHTN